MLVHENIRQLEGSGSHFVARAGRSIGNILVDEGKLDDEDVHHVMQLQNSQGLKFGEAALRLGLINEDDLRNVVAKQYGVPRLDRGTNLSHELVSVYAPYHQRTEELRALRTALLVRWSKLENTHHALAVVSPGAGEGRSYIAANLAVVFARLGKRTLLIDGDMRAPRQHEIFSVANRIGLSAVLSGRGDRSAAVPIPDIPGLSVLPAGSNPPNPQELLSDSGFFIFLKELQTRFDIIIVDTPPAKPYADAQTIVFRTGSALVVTRKNHTRVEDANDVVKELRNIDAHIPGTVLNSF